MIYAIGYTCLSLLIGVLYVAWEESSETFPTPIFNLGALVFLIALVWPVIAIQCVLGLFVKGVIWCLTKFQS